MNGEFHRTDDEITLDRYKKHDIEVVVDRLDPANDRSRLVEACENALPTQIIHLCVRISNEEAIRMYKMAGYYNIDRWVKYYTDGEDGLIMEKLKEIGANSAL